MASPSMALPPGAELVDSPQMKLPPGAELVAQDKEESKDSPIGDALADVAKGAWSKLNPVNILKGMADTASAGYHHPIDTAVHALSGQIDTLKKAKQSWDEAREAKTPEERTQKIREAATHLSSALTPGGFLTDETAVKANTPGHHAEGIGEALGSGLAAYLGAKSPEIVKAASEIAPKAAGMALRAAGSLPDVPDVATDVAGVVHPVAAHALKLTNRLTRGAQKLSDALYEHQNKAAVAEIPTAAEPPPLPVPEAPAPYFTGGATGGVTAPPAIPGGTPAPVSTPPVAPPAIAPVAPPVAPPVEAAPIAAPAEVTAPPTVEQPPTPDPVPQSMLDNETTGVQNAPAVANRGGVASRAASFLHENGITVKDIEAAKEDPTAHDLFWNNVGRIPGVSKQSHYVPSVETQDGILDALTKLEKSGQAPQKIPAATTGPLANNPKALEIAKQMASAMGEEEPKPLQSVPKIPQATDLTPDERTVEQSFATKIAADPAAAIKEYKDKFTRPNGTLEIGADNARELSPEYAESKNGRTAYAKAVHEPSSWLSKRVFEDEVTKPAPKGTENRVVLTGGGTGAGKTTGTSVLPPGQKPPQLIFDTNSNSLESAQSKIKMALDNGKEVSIIYVHRLPEDAFESMIDRAHKTGRTVPMEAHIETHTGAPSTLVKLAEIYKDNPKVDIKVADNTHGVGGIRPGTIDMLKNLDYTGLEGRLNDALEARKQAGTITPEIYRAIKGGGSDAGSSSEEPELSKSEGAGGQAEGGENPGSDQSGSQDASQTEVIIPGENRGIPAQYKLRELADVQASHNGNTFQKNPKYAYTNDRDYTRGENQQKIVEGALSNRFKPSLHITDNPDASNGPILVDSKGNAMGGNGRTMMLQRVYKSNPKGAQEYRDLLKKKADQFGIDPNQVAKMNQPVLVREIADEHIGNAQNAVTDFNKTGTAALRPSERAIADSRRVSADTLSHVASRLEEGGPSTTLNSVLAGKNGPGVLDKLIDDGVISPQERAAYQSGKVLTEDGKARISKLLLGRFFRDPAQLDSMPTALKNKLERIAAPLAKTEEAGEEWSLTPKIQRAMDLLEESRVHGGTLDDLLNQGGFFKKDEFPADVVSLAKAIQKTPTRNLLTAVNDYAQDASYAAKGDTLLGESPDPKDSIKRLLDAAKKPKATSKKADEKELATVGR